MGVDYPKGVLSGQQAHVPTVGLFHPAETSPENPPPDARSNTVSQLGSGTNRQDMIDSEGQTVQKEESSW
jgi:hypothetical protein